MMERQNNVSIKNFHLLSVTLAENASVSTDDVPTITSRVVSSILLLVFAAVGIPGNVVILHIFVSKHHRNKLRIRGSTARILGNLTAADLIDSCANIPVCFALFVISTNQKTSILLSNIHFLITTPALFLNCACLILLSIDRHDVLLRPHRYRLHDKRLKITIIIVWTLAIAIGVCGFLRQKRFFVWRPETFVLFTPNVFVLFICIIAIFSVILSHIKIKKSVRGSNRVCANPDISRLQKCRQLAERRITKAMVLITVVLLFTYIPWVTGRFAYVVKGTRFHADVYVICRVMLLISHVVHPVIYVCVSTDFRHVIKMLLPCRGETQITRTGESHVIVDVNRLQRIPLSGLRL